ncbi:hypothetical protein KFL_009510030 [Klebsormidium nitens]|uniref:Uncharacterized protein n=1 Tax=Klebsormidium nitens TaxID=105231 RepID=A0A1Y1IMX2_KLENI|nr:hypothetical protein KFL_009510030 [Klebsormidium nitens]|eukprot:GAQ92230.1 hypothetical protein KFL_009510030 [Klebsormidium nitens]
MRRIKEHTDWLLESDNPWFSQRALHNVIRRGGWEVDPANEKQKMRNYLGSIERSAAETQERRGKARKLIQKIDVDTGRNKQSRSLQKTMMQQTGKVQVGVVGGVQNRSDRFAPWESCAPGLDHKGEWAPGERRGNASADTQMGRRGQGSDINSAFSAVGLDGADKTRSLGNFGGSNVSIDYNDPSAMHTGETDRYGGAFGQQTYGNDGKEGVFTFRASSRASFAPASYSQEPDTNLHPPFGMPAGPSHANNTFPAAPRQILGELATNFHSSQPAPPRKALLRKEKPPTLKPGLSGPIEATWPEKDQLIGGEWGSEWASGYEGTEFAGFGRASRDESERKTKESGVGAAQHTRQMAEAVPGLAPGEIGARGAFGTPKWEPRAANHAYGQALDSPPGWRMTSLSEWRPRERTSHASWQPDGYQAGAELRLAFSDGRSFVLVGHSTDDFDPGRHVYGVPSCHVYWAEDRGFEGARSSAQAMHEIGRNIGGSLKRRRDDVDSDEEPRAKRGGDNSGFNNWRIQPRGPVSIRIVGGEGNTANNNYYNNSFYGGRTDVHQTHRSQHPNEAARGDRTSAMMTLPIFERRLWGKCSRKSRPGTGGLRG